MNEDKKVEVGKVVTVNLQRARYGEEQLTFRMTDGTDDSLEITSINSPLGRCILGQKEGFEGEYSVLSDTIKVKVIGIK